MVIGIVGGYCAGKSEITTSLSQDGWVTIDLDKIGHLAHIEKKDLIVQHFGTEVLNHQGAIDRQALGRIVFSHSQEMKALEAIVHPWMVEYVEGVVATSSNVVVDAAVLFTAGLGELCDLIIFVDTPYLVRVYRGMKRDGLSFTQSWKRVKKVRHIIPRGVKKMEKVYTISGMGKSGVGQVRKIIRKIQGAADGQD